MKTDEYSGLVIDKIWPVSTLIFPNGGIGVRWHGDIGFGEFALVWGDDGILYADTEGIDNMEDKRFTAAILSLLVEMIVPE